MTKKVEGEFILGNGRVSGNPYLKKFVQAQAGQQVTPVGITVRKKDPDKMLHVTMTSGKGLFQDVPINLFARHPPVEMLRPLATLI